MLVFSQGLSTNPIKSEKKKNTLSAEGTDISLPFVRHHEEIFPWRKKKKSRYFLTSSLGTNSTHITFIHASAFHFCLLPTFPISTLLPRSEFIRSLEVIVVVFWVFAVGCAFQGRSACPKFRAAYMIFRDITTLWDYRLYD